MVHCLSDLVVFCLNTQAVMCMVQVSTTVVTLLMSKVQSTVLFTGLLQEARRPMHRKLLQVQPPRVLAAAEEHDVHQLATFLHHHLHAAGTVLQNNCKACKRLRLKSSICYKFSSGCSSRVTLMKLS